MENNTPAENRGLGFVARTFIARFSSLGVLVILVVLVAALAIFSPGHNFIRVGNLRNLLAIGPEFLVISLGVGLLMIAGEFDLSVGSILAFSAFVFNWLYIHGMGPLGAFLLCLASGAVAGLINGLVTVKGKILSFVTTLGTMMLWRGLTLLLSGGQMYSLDIAERRGLLWVTSARLGGFFPIQAVWFFLVAAVLGLLLHRHRFGNWIYSTGDNPGAACSMCINTDRVKIVCFVIVGLLCSLGALMQTVRIAAFSSHAGTGYELSAIAAAVVGGTSLRGGRGSMLGIFMGSIIIIVIENAFSLARLPYEWTYTVYGLVVLIAVLLDLAIGRLRVRS